MNEKEKKKSAEDIKELKAFYDAYLKRIKLGFDVYAKNRSLSKEDKKKLLNLKYFDAGVSKEQLLINTTQKSIPFKKMYEDGICQVTDTFFTKMIEFDDINYELLEVEERGEVLEEYSKFINYFDPSIKFQLFFFRWLKGLEYNSNRYNLELFNKLSNNLKSLDYESYYFFNEIFILYSF